ncbi:hypothetical protein EDD18DRAFT_1408530 [Armillaria luteobubalina]|uniref:Uncharacterized protein n=1 Tax=Armillaria luteobubalina TaxID=153913 RepID=A0AA39Q0D9_9AGAR|nr:hypothetical protein EDD18DRAFT_1408530 [Armillaria luteobubalina]
MFFQRRHIHEQFFFQGDVIPTQITHPNGTINVTFPSNGLFIVDAIASGTDHLNLLNSSGLFDFSVASESGNSATTLTSTFSTSSPGETGQTPSTYESAIPPSASSANGNRNLDIQLLSSERDERLGEDVMGSRHSRLEASTPLRADTSEPQMGGSVEQQEGPPASPAAMGHMAAEILRLTNQVRQLVFEREAGEFPGSASDPPPPYA